MASDGSKPVRIGLLGRGTVGAAFAELLAERAEAVEAATGRRPEISGALTRGEGDFDSILAGSDLIVELMGGTEPARAHVLVAPRAGKPVVTANKQLLAQHGDELFAVAREAGVQLRFEAAVAAVIPIVRTIQESFGVTEISKVFGIVNGTTNFILTEMAASGAGYDEVLAQAQELGYAEADPTDDVSGADAAAKMAILARLAFHTPVTLDEVTFEGIERVLPDDLAYAKEFGLSLKLLGVAERRDGGISVRVFPCFLYRGHPLAPIEGPFNAVMVEAPAISEVTMSGPGAGGGGGGGGRGGGCSPPGRCSAPSSRSSPATRRCTRRGSSCRSSRTSAPPSTSTSRSPTSPACWRGWRRCSATTASRSRASSSAGSATRPGW